MNARLRITAKLVLAFVLLAAGLLATVTVLVFSNGRAALQTATFAELEARASEKQAALTMWVGDGQSSIASIAALPSLRRELQGLGAVAGGTAASRRLHDQVVMDLQPFSGQASRFVEESLLDPRTGQVVAATDRSEEGTYKEDRPYFINGKRAPYVQNVYYSPSLGGPAMTAAAPVFSERGHLLAVVAGRLNLPALNAIIALRSDLRRSDDAFLVNTSNLFVTQPRLLADPAVLQRGVHTVAVDRCLSHGSGSALERDYRDVPVITVYRWLPLHQLCLIVTLDQAEAFGPIRAFGGAVALIGSLALLSALLITVGLARTITRPILALQAGVIRFGRGDLAMRLPEHSGDELGVLAYEFNRMAAAIAEKDARLRALFAAMTDVILVFDGEGRYLDLLPAHLSAPQQPQRSTCLHDAFPHALADTLLGHIRRALETRQPVNAEYRVLHGDTETWFAAAIAPMLEDTVIWVARDITARRQNEAALQERNRELQRSNAELEQFAYIASHDLQEPMRTVTSYVQLLSQRYSGTLDADADEFIGYAVEGATRMQTLVDALLAYVCLGMQDAPFVPTDCTVLVQRTLAVLGAAIQQTGARITYDPLPTVQADAGQLGQVFQNLIRNALTFCDGPPEVHISAQRHGAEWHISVRDHGIGLDPAYAERIFAIFQRLHTRQEYPGTGIGLAICQKIVGRHGGHIWVESQPGGGATFTFTLPASEGGAG